MKFLLIKYQTFLQFKKLIGVEANDPFAFKYDHLATSGRPTGTPLR